MSANVAKVQLRPKGENGSFDATPTSTQFYKYYVVEASSVSTGAEVIAVANDGTNSVPAMYSTLAGTNLQVINIHPTRDGNSKFWEVQVTYGTPPTLTTGGDSTIWGVTISVDGVLTEEDTDSDASGNAIVNKAGDTFDPSLKREVWSQEVTISYNSTTVDLSSIDDCLGCINSADVDVTINGLDIVWPSKCLKLVKSRYSTLVLPQFGDAIQIWSVDLVFHYRPPYTALTGGGEKGGWVRQVENKGYYALNDDGKRYLITDDMGQPKSKPSFLTTDGKVLAPGGTVNYVYAEQENAVNFGGLFTGIGG